MYESLTDAIKKSKYLVFFGGAGVSTESGIPDFRSADGLYGTSFEGCSPEEILSASCFQSNPELFYKFYREKMLFPDAKPGKAHFALAELERRGKCRCVITQNIDGLHQSAGSKMVLELHGTVHKNRCMRCGRTYALDAILKSEGLPRCKLCGGLIKPCVTLYGEPLPEGVFEAAAAAVRRADLLIIGGTSLTVYPAAGLASLFQGDCIAVLNRDATPADRTAGIVIRDPVGEVLDAAVKAALHSSDP